MEEITKYVAGFFFDENADRVWLIKKNKPSWQKGLLNAIGGKIEEGETPYQAMMREFIEETGHNPYGIWTQYATIKGKDWEVNFFYVFATTHDEFLKPTTTTDEVIEWKKIEDVPKIRTISNLPWLIELALDTAINGIDYQISAGIPLKS